MLNYVVMASASIFGMFNVLTTAFHGISEMREDGVGGGCEIRW